MDKDLIKKTAKELNLPIKEVREIILQIESQVEKKIRALPEGNILEISIPYFGRFVTDTRTKKQKQEDRKKYFELKNK